MMPGRPPNHPIVTGARFIFLISELDKLTATIWAHRTALVGMANLEDVDRLMREAASRLRSASELLGLRAEDLIREANRIESESPTKPTVPSPVAPCPYKCEHGLVNLGPTEVAGGLWPSAAPCPIHGKGA